MGTPGGLPSIGPDVEAHLRTSEAAVRDLRPGAEKRVLWVDETIRTPTPIALVYIHGFSADSHEVEPLVTDLARAIGANAYFARLAGHGRSAEAMGEATVDAWLADAAEAVAVGQAIGERIVLIGTSTGGTLATWVAEQPELRGRLAALVLLSPNFHPRDRMSRLLLWPWGGVLARLVVGRERCFDTHGSDHARHWTECYPTRALLPMMALTEHVRTSDLAGVEVPTVVFYVPGDEIVDTRETAAAFDRLGSETKVLVPVPDPGDPDRHVPAGDILSPTSTEVVGARIRGFLGSLGVPIEIGGAVR